MRDSRLGPEVAMSRADIGKYVLFNHRDEKDKVKPCFSSFDLSKVIAEAKNCKKKDKKFIPIIQEIGDPKLSWNY